MKRVNVTAIFLAWCP